MKHILAIDIGGNTVKVLVSGEKEPRALPSGPTLTAKQMADGVRKLTEDWEYEAVSIGYPGRVRDNKILAEPVNLGSGWVHFDFQKALGAPVRILNDAAMQAIGSYKGGKMLFLGLGTGLGTALIVDGAVLPMELGHMPYKGGTYEQLLGLKGLTRVGIKKWRESVFEVVALFIDIFQLDEVVIGGGNINKLDRIPPGCRAGDNALAFVGGFLLWRDEPTRGNRRPHASR